MPLVIHFYTNRCHTRKLPERDLSHDQLRQVCEELRKDCAPCCLDKNKSTRKRSMATVVQAWQRLLLVKILTYLPVRQQELRQYAPQRTLFLETDQEGNQFYVVRGIHHKLEHHTGETRSYRIPDILKNDLDQWINIYCSKIRAALETEETWLEFLGYEPDYLAKLKSKLENAKQENVHFNVKNHEAYMKRLEKELKLLIVKLSNRERIQENFSCHQTLFFHCFNSTLEIYGKPIIQQGLSNLVATSVAQVTKQLFGRSYWVTPHSFRHIAARHVRQVQGNKQGLAALMNHSEQMSEEYADQLVDEITLTAGLDKWWEGDPGQ